MRRSGSAPAERALLPPSPQPRVLPQASHIQESQAPNVIPATASPVHSRVGVGCPVALQRNSASCPGCTVSCGGWIDTTGADGAPEADGRKNMWLGEVSSELPGCSLCFYSSPSGPFVHRAGRGSF